MGGFLAVPGCVKIEVIHDLSGVPVVNVLHAGYDGTSGVQSNLEAVALGVAVAWVDNVMPLLSVDLTCKNVTVTDLASISSPQGVHDVEVAGSDTGDALSSNAACAISWHEAIRYRGGHGRSYLGGITQAKLDTVKTWTTGFTAAVHAAAIEITAAISALDEGAYGNFIQTILHARMATTHPVPDPPVYVPPFQGLVTGNSVDTRVDSQRRRLGKP